MSALVITLLLASTLDSFLAFSTACSNTGRCNIHELLLSLQETIRKLADKAAWINNMSFCAVLHL